MNRKQTQLAQVSSFFTLSPKSSENARKRAMSVTIVSKTNESGIIRPQRKKANVTGKKILCDRQISFITGHDDR